MAATNVTKGQKSQPAKPPVIKKAAPKPKAEPGLRKMVVLEEGVLAGMAVNDVFAKQFGFLNKIHAVGKSENGKKVGCGGCSRAAAERAEAFTAVKQAIASMDATRKRQLKDLLRAQQVRLTYKNASNKVVQLTF
jgi:hypothetical protein